MANHEKNRRGWRFTGFISRKKLGLRGALRELT